MVDWVIGPGVAQAISDAGDEPRSDEQYVLLAEGHKVSQTFGRDAVYYWIQEDNRVNRIPFEVAEPPEPETVTWDPNVYMAPQLYSWTCAACSLDWVLKATVLEPGSGDVYTDRERTVYQIGYPGNINSTYGLMDSSGSALRAVLDGYGQPSGQSWLDFDTVYSLAGETTGLMSGAEYYHWVGLRGRSGGNLWIANSAPGYRGVWDILTRDDFSRLGGWSVVWLDL